MLNVEVVPASIFADKRLHSIKKKILHTAGKVLETRDIW